MRLDPDGSGPRGADRHGRLRSLGNSIAEWRIIERLMRDTGIEPPDKELSVAPPLEQGLPDLVPALKLLDGFSFSVRRRARSRALRSGTQLLGELLIGAV